MIPDALNNHHCSTRWADALIRTLLQRCVEYHVEIEALEDHPTVLRDDPEQWTLDLDEFLHNSTGQDSGSSGR